MRLAHDPTLTTLAKAAGNLPLIGEPPPGLPANESDFRDEVTKKIRFVTHLHYCDPVQRWEVRLSLAGRQLLLAKLQSGLTAIRLSDMLVLHFWKYRKQRVLEIRDGDLNHGVAYARADYERNPQVVEWMNALEKHIHAVYGLAVGGNVLTIGGQALEHWDQLRRTCKHFRARLRETPMTEQTRKHVESSDITLLRALDEIEGALKVWDTAAKESFSPDAINARLGEFNTKAQRLEEQQRRARLAGAPNPEADLVCELGDLSARWQEKNPEMFE